MQKPGIERIIEFQQLLLKFSHIDRMIHRKPASNKGYVLENDSEHSYNLAMTAWFLAEYFPELDKDLVIRLALIHDLVEVHAGDTYVFADEAELASKKDRERAALQKLKKEWDDFKSLTDHIMEYENLTSSEAKFVYALDKVLPVITIYINEGFTWKDKSITTEMLYKEKIPKVSLFPDIESYYLKLHELLLRSPHLIEKS
jgi:putative hydrolase of HD superfamily